MSSYGSVIMGLLGMNIFSSLKISKNLNKNIFHAIQLRTVEILIFIMNGKMFY